MSIDDFKKHLEEKNHAKDSIEAFIDSLSNLDTALKGIKKDINSMPKGWLVTYTEELVKKKPDEVVHLISALYSYSYFSKNYYYAEEVIDIAESHNAMENLYKRVADLHGEKIRDEIFKDIEIPPLGVHPEKKPEVTKIVIKRLEKVIGEEKTIQLLKPCLHSRDKEPIYKDKEKFEELNDIDKFLALKRQDIIKQAEQHRKEGSYWFAQFVDDEVLEYVKNTPTVGAGVREGNRIIVTKIPYQIKKYLNAKDKNMKKFYACYCPWVRGALKKGEANEISKNFCECSGGFFKIYWDIIFDQDVTIDLLESPVLGHTICKFAVRIPKNIKIPTE